MIHKKIDCPLCGGSGVLILLPCFRCLGDGFIYEDELRWKEMTDEQKSKSQEYP